MISNMNMVMGWRRLHGRERNGLIISVRASTLFFFVSSGIFVIITLETIMTLNPRFREQTGRLAYM